MHYLHMVAFGVGLIDQKVKASNSGVRARGFSAMLNGITIFAIHGCMVVVLNQLATYDANIGFCREFYQFISR